MIVALDNIVLPETYTQNFYLIYHNIDGRQNIRNFFEDEHLKIHYRRWKTLWLSFIKCYRVRNKMQPV